MSQRDVLAELRTARVEAPPQLRARVRLVAAHAPTPQRPRRWRLALVASPLVAAAIAGGVVLSTRTTPHHYQVLERAAVTHGSAASAFNKAATPAPSATRIQRYGASLQVQVRDVPAAVTKAVRVATSLGGFAESVHVSTARTHGDAELTLRVPRLHVQQAVARLSRLGAVTSEQVDIQDVQAGINTANRTIARLQQQLKSLRALPPTAATKREIAAVTAQVVARQRQDAQTIRGAHFATVQLSLSTPPMKTRAQHHYVRDALPWLGGAVAALVLLLALRGLGRVREERLLSRP